MFRKKHNIVNNPLTLHLSNGLKRELVNFTVSKIQSETKLIEKVVCNLHFQTVMKKTEFKNPSNNKKIILLRVLLC